MVLLKNDISRTPHEEAKLKYDELIGIVVYRLVSIPDTVNIVFGLLIIDLFETK